MGMSNCHGQVIYHQIRAGPNRLVMIYELEMISIFSQVDV